MKHDSPIKPDLPIGEFVALMALLISLVALSIDAMLPALPAIGADLGASGENETQLVLTALFLGLATGQLVYGPVSDSVGRKPAIYAGLALFMAGCALSIFARDFETMLAGRFLQGAGAAGPRIVTLALVRDQYAGRAMARIMSFVMGVFILVPALAPALGQGVLLFGSWRLIFTSFLGLAAVGLIWFAVRQPETLERDRQVPLSLKNILTGMKECCTNRVALGYTISAGLIFGGFVGYLVSAQQIFQEQYGVGAQFPTYFAVLALSIGSASFFNAKLVMRYGMRLLSGRALIVLSVLSVLFLAYAWTVAGHPPLSILMTYWMVAFFCFGILFGNFNALAMEPLGHIAGVAAAMIGSLTTFISLFLGTLIGQLYSGTVLPLTAGFALLGIASIVVMYVAEKEVRY